MDFGLAKFAALCALFSAVCGAPAALQDACADVQRSSLALNRYSKTAAVQARNQSADQANFSFPAWMGGKDLCDPESLKKKSAPCVRKIFSVLTSYKSAVQRISGLTKCSGFSKNVKPAVDNLHKDMSKCVKSFGGWKHDEESHIHDEDIPDWQEELLCRDTLERLFSFSILTARVFAPGNPANHAEGSAQKCM